MQFVELLNTFFLARFFKDTNHHHTFHQNGFTSNSIQVQLIEQILFLRLKKNEMKKKKFIAEKRMKHIIIHDNVKAQSEWKKRGRLVNREKK